MKQFVITPAAGKSLIGKGMAAHPEIIKVLKTGMLVIIAGTTNGYAAREILALIGEEGKLPTERFFRGITLPPAYVRTQQGRLTDESKFPGDVVIQKGKWLPGKVIDDVVADLQEGDIILKGANAVDIERRQAAILIGHPAGGTILHSLRAVVGRRARLILPVGLEKRVSCDLYRIAADMNLPGGTGNRLLPVPGEIFTEIEALALLTGVRAELFAAGGVSGAEGSIWLALNGTPENEKTAIRLLESVAKEPNFVV